MKKTVTLKQDHKFHHFKYYLWSPKSTTERMVSQVNPPPSASYRILLRVTSILPIKLKKKIEKYSRTMAAFLNTLRQNHKSCYSHRFFGEKPRFSKCFVFWFLRYETTVI